MIYALKGKVVNKMPGHIYLDTGNGILYDIFTPLSYFSSIGKDENILLYTVMKIKDEDPQIFGFQSEKEKEFFLKMISISGIGSKTALLIISSFTIKEFVIALENSDVLKLSSIPGIGKKTAQRIILELSGKIIFDDEDMNEGAKVKNDLISALVNLGYPHRGVKTAVEEVLKEDVPDKSFESLFKLILKRISKV
ncbi:MAG: Holliday junction branch migration protein RuvA [Acidobacteriota bacterium]